MSSGHTILHKHIQNKLKVKHERNLILVLLGYGHSALKAPDSLLRVRGLGKVNRFTIERSESDRGNMWTQVEQEGVQARA